eukprot:scaffold8701_cov28-Tisochrysis_lutea.AAC.3
MIHVARRCSFSMQENLKYAAATADFALIAERHLKSEPISPREPSLTASLRGNTSVPPGHQSANTKACLDASGPLAMTWKARRSNCIPGLTS